MACKLTEPACAPPKVPPVRAHRWTFNIPINALSNKKLCRAITGLVASLAHLHPYHHVREKVRFVNIGGERRPLPRPQILLVRRYVKVPLDHVPISRCAHEEFGKRDVPYYSSPHRR